MIALDLWFSSFEQPELIKTELQVVSDHALITCVRGKTAGASKTNQTFQWTAAVKAMCLLVANTKINNQYCLSGETGSPAASLDYALSKEPNWLGDMFGFSATGRLNALRLFMRTNPSRKRLGPVEISLNSNMLSASSIKLHVDGKTISSPEELGRLIDALQDDVSDARSNKRAEEEKKALTKTLARTDSKFNCVIGETDLIVTKAVTASWNLDELLGNFGISCSHITLDWSDEILQAIENNEVHLAIYNNERSQHYIGKSKLKKANILCDLGHSMGGKNFYILAKKGSKWRQYSSVDEFNDAISQGATIALPARSDMFSNLLQVLNCDESELDARNIRVIHIPVSQGLEAFDFDPNLLLIHGQNVRFKASYRGDYFEALNYDSLPAELKGQSLRNSKNCVLYNNDLLNYIDHATLLAQVDAAKKHFSGLGTDEASCATICDYLKVSSRRYGPLSDDEGDYIVKRILFETYRFGSPC